MWSRRFLVLWLALGLLCLAPAVAAQAANAEPVQPPIQALTQLWRAVFRGALEETPIILGERALVAVKLTEQQRQLVVVDLGTGRQLAQRSFTTTKPLGVARHGNTLAVRTQPGRVEFLNLERDRFLSGRVINGRSVSPACFTADGVAIMIRDAELLAIHPRETQPRWIVPGSWRGRVVVHGGFVFAVEFTDGVAQLAQIHARTGRLLTRMRIGDHGGVTPTLEDVGPHAVVLDDAVWIRFDRPLRARSKTDRFTTSRVARRPDGSLDEHVTLHSLIHDPLPLPDGTLLCESTPTGTRWVFNARDNDLLRVLSDGEHAPELLEAPAAALGGGLIYIGRDVVDAHDHSVRFQLKVNPTTRPVPVHHGVLVTSSPRVLEFHGSTPPNNAARKQAREITLGIERKLGDGFAALAQLAIRSNDEQLSRRLVREAEVRGARSQSFIRAQGTLERWSRGSRKAVINTQAADDVRAKERALKQAGDRALVDQARKERPDIRRELLRDVLQRQPAHAHALAEVARSLPFDVDRVATDPLGWLDVATLNENSVLEFVDEHSSNAFARRRLATERARWRDDVLVVATDRLVLVAPPSVPGALAQAVRLGELVCDCLDEIFGVTSAGDPLTLIVHPDRESYSAFADESISGWSAGHYDPNEALCRLYVPEDGDALARFRSTYVHELTHHWISSRAPFVRRPADRSGESDTPAFWLCEGFATLLEEFRFDVENGSWEAHDPRAPSLDVVASAASSELLDWRDVLSISQEQFLLLDDSNRKVLPRRFILGGSAVVSDKRLFYIQAAAAAHYLFQRREREQLLDALAAWYQDRTDAVRTWPAFGIDAGALGRDIQAWARSATGLKATGRLGSSSR